MTQHWQPDARGEGEPYLHDTKRKIALAALRGDVNHAAWILSELTFAASTGENDPIRNAVVSIVSGNSQDLERVGDVLQAALVDSVIREYDEVTFDGVGNVTQWDRLAKAWREASMDCAA